ncbi:NADH-quinone oxidoreductase subunit N [Nitrosomonas marina]|uniref:NADH-quinone oxidoreductase subunit N n=1 Tax=Nitrosomonas marina TaxID=917 RepID=A0A1H8HWL0_9PROT|nr:NADH-quinone oxidoreductase subunit N [Nitrosomonas marina]SEN60437.1 NADH dehydrogenase subunit N [Nitrosomonas marina]
MQAIDLINLGPFIILGLGGITVLGLGILPGHVSTRTLTAVTIIVLILGTAATILWKVPHEIDGILVFDRLSRLFIQLCMLGAIVITVLSLYYPPTQKEMREEYLSLILFTTLGMVLFISSQNLVMAFVGLEILSVPLFALIAWLPKQKHAIEGGIKYAMLAGIAAAFFLYGTTLAYVNSGSLNITALSQSLSDGHLPAIAVTLLLVGMGFKLALVPFHMWSPDIYQAAPAPVTALFASIAKAAVLIFLIRLLCLNLQPVWEALLPLLWILAVISMFAGNLLALFQQNIKRLLAYSSIAHIGYIFVALAAGNSLGRDAAIYYSLAYALMNLGAFAVVAALALSDKDRQSLEEYRGLGRQYPILGISMAISLLALAGLPPTAGFVAKLLAFGSAVEAGHFILAIIAVINTAIAFYYYLHILIIFFAEEKERTGQYIVPLPRGTLASVIVINSLIIGLGIFPELITTDFP